MDSLISMFYAGAGQLVRYGVVKSGEVQDECLFWGFCRGAYFVPKL